MILCIGFFLPRLQKEWPSCYIGLVSASIQNFGKRRQKQLSRVGDSHLLSKQAAAFGKYATLR